MGKLRDFDISTPIHITQKAINSEFKFLDSYYKEYYCLLMGKSAKLFDIKLFNYAIMDNHVHILACELQRGELSRALQLINTKFSMALNRSLSRTGPVWNSRSSWTPMESSSHLLDAMLYVDFNPVRAKIVRDPRNYEFSGTQELIGKRKPVAFDMKYIGKALRLRNFDAKKYNSLISIKLEEDVHRSTPRFTFG